MNPAKKAVLVVAATGAVLGASVGTASAHDHDFDGAGAAGSVVGSPGLDAGNLLQLPVHGPAAACGLTVDGGGLLNHAFGNKCADV